MTSLSHTLDYIEVARRRLPIKWPLDRQTLKLTERTGTNALCIVRHVALTVDTFIHLRFIIARQHTAADARY